MKMELKLRVKMLSDSGLKKTYMAIEMKKTQNKLMTIQRHSNKIWFIFIYIWICMHTCSIDAKYRSKKKYHGLLTSILKGSLMSSYMPYSPQSDT